MAKQIEVKKNPAAVALGRLGGLRGGPVEYAPYSTGQGRPGEVAPHFTGQGGRTADILQAILFQRDLLTGLIRGQEKWLAMGLPAREEPAPVTEDVARQVFALVHELETDGRSRE